MKRFLIAAGIAIVTFVALAFASDFYLTLSSQHLDANGIPNLLTAQQQDALDAALGMAAVASAAVGLIAGAIYWWRTGRPIPPISSTWPKQT